MTPDSIRQLVEDATFDFTMGEHSSALEKLDRALAEAPEDFDGLHAKAEILFDCGRHEEASKFAEKALSVRSDDVHLHTSLSRIWMELGDKAKAEHHGAQARMLGWKSELQNRETNDS